MAVSVRIEDEAFSDRRYDVLAHELGLPDADCARGKMAAVWRQCTQQQTHILTAKMIATILGDKGVDALLQSALGAEVDGGIRICGTRGRIEWLARLRKNGQKGGRPRKPKGNQKETIWFSDEKPGANPPAPAPAPAPAQTEKDASPHNPDRALALRLILKIIGNFPGNKLARQSPSEKDATILKWSEHVRRMREIDRRSESDIAAVIDWCQADSFWRKNIWSTDKLRDKWDRLIADMGSKAPRQVKRVAEQPALEFPIGDCEVLR